LSANFKGRGHAPTNFGVIQLESLGYHARGVVYVILCLAVLIQYRRVQTDRQTDRQTDTR